MNTPNKLTLLRILLIPFMVIVIYIPYLNEKSIFLNVSIANFINFIIFTIASLTDFLDGYLARKNNLVTTFGKFADPLADKLLVMTAMVILMLQGVFPIWGVIVILSREFIVTGVRLVAVDSGKVIAASNLGKLKTIFTMVGLILLFFYQIHFIVELIAMIVVYIAIVFTIVSGFDYIFKNKEIIFENF